MIENSNRVVHITLEKSGSQWVRDVLTASEIIRHSGLVNSGITLNTRLLGNYDLPYKSFSGPIYGMNQWEWKYWKQPGDKAVVVLRDPRDALISLVYSTLYSHSSNGYVDAYRDKLPTVQISTHINRMMVGIGPLTARMYLTWASELDESAILIKYEDLIKDQFGEFKKIIDWLGWQVPSDTLQTVVNRLSFEERSGRATGVTDIFSHYRKGVAGDWTNHFTREQGERWESLLPGCLRAIGYENSDDWWTRLPINQNSNGNDQLIQTQESKTTIDSVRYEAMRKRNLQLEKDLAEKEKVIRSLAQACEERLALINTLAAKQ